ncbi:MAG: NHLP family bacteriocin export ABC transporter peptidase/permease/ATPase subunit [Bacillota bacterium]
MFNLPGNWRKITGLKQKIKRVKVPTVLQMEAVECGPASLAMVLGYYGRFVPLEELRLECGVSRDGSRAGNLLKAARKYGLRATGYRLELERVKKFQGPMIIYWNFNHFLVLEGFKKGLVYLNDPASGPRRVTEEEFDHSFTGVALTFEPGPDFQKGGEKSTIIPALKSRLKGFEHYLTYLTLAGLMMVLPGLVIPVFTRIFVDNILLQNMKSWVFPLLIGMGLTAFLRMGLTWLQNFYLLKMETKLALSTSGKFFWHVLRLPMQFFAQRYSGEIGARVQINDQVAQFLSGRLARTALDCMAITFYFVLMLRYDVLLALVGLFIAFLNILYLQFVARKREDQNQKLLQDRGKLLGTSMAGLQIIETLKAGGNESDFFARWAGYKAKVVNAEQEMGVSNGYLAVVPFFLDTLNVMLIISIGGLHVMNGQLTIGMLVAFQSLMSSFLEPVRSLVIMGSTLQEMKGNINRVEDVLRYQVDSRLADLDSPEGLPAGPVKINGFLELKDVTFGYSRLEPPLIENFNLKMRPGSRVALVGGSGSGKSTIAKLVAGLYQPWSGEIFFDGKPRSSIPRPLITNSLSVVDQDIILFEGTVRDNLTLWDSTIAEADVVQAARDACIHEDIASRDGGYDHLVEEGGRNFSGGQQQRMEIARALAGKPAILILDEATSALDPVTEKIINDNMRRRGSTLIVVAHRLSTIRDCDEIIVLEKGKVAQRGTHEQMKDAEGPYANLIGE